MCTPPPGRFCTARWRRPGWDGKRPSRSRWTAGRFCPLRPRGGRLSQRFDLGADGFAGWYFSRRGSHLRHPACGRQEDPYLLELKSIASSLGYSGEEIDDMLDEGWTTDEIEEALYGWEMDGLPCM